MQHHRAEEVLRAELRAAKQESEEAAKRAVAGDRRVVQLQHEARRKELEFERLQERCDRVLEGAAVCVKESSSKSGT